LGGSAPNATAAPAAAASAEPCSRASSAFRRVAEASSAARADSSPAGPWVAMGARSGGGHARVRRGEEGEEGKNVAGKKPAERRNLKKCRGKST
jgi:hypothetical protein